MYIPIFSANLCNKCNYRPGGDTVELMHIDLRTGASELIVTIPVDRYLGDPSFSGNFAAMLLGGFGVERILLVHLRPEPTAVPLSFRGYTTVLIFKFLIKLGLTFFSFSM
jgi:hypothetical protein